MDKRPRTGLLVLMVAVGAGAVGYVLGRFQAEEAPPARPYAPATRPVVEVAAQRPAHLDHEHEIHVDVADPEETEEGGEAPTPAELLDSLREHAGSPRSQQILLGMVADAARTGGKILPEIKQLLDSGADITFTSYDPRNPGFPSLRVALMAAAEATGDPAATEMIQEVAETTESPVEVVFSAHLLDRLDALDAPTAQRTLDSLAQDLTPEQRKAMSAVVGKVIPAAAAADPVYAENFLLTQLRITEGPRANARTATLALNGLPLERAREIVLSTMAAPDVSDQNKRVLVGRAASRNEIAMLTELRQAIERQTVSPRVASTIASHAVSGRPFSVIEKKMRRAVKAGDLDTARNLTTQFQRRLNEARTTIAAARTMGARVNKQVDTRAKLHNDRLDILRAQLRRAYQKREREQAKKG